MVLQGLSVVGICMNPSRGFHVDLKLTGSQICIKAKKKYLSIVITRMSAQKHGNQIE